MRTFRIIARILVGIVFIYSGFVKGVDPLGSTYKFIDYFEAFGLGFLDSFAFPLSFFMSTAEVVLGIAMLIGLRMRFFSWAVLVFMIFFTVLTFILAIYNPVSDCGCFGDALILTNWETFWKNVVILGVVLFVFWQRHRYVSVYSSSTEWGFVALAFVVFLLFSVYNFNHLPVMDFRPYQVGTYIPEDMELPEGAQPDVYETTFYYKNKKTGKIKKFSEDNYPWKDTATWEFVEYENELIKKGDEPPIHDFEISDEEGQVITEEILNDPDYSFLLISHNVHKAEKSAFMKAQEIADLCRQDSLFSFYGVSSSSSSKIKALKRDQNISFDFYSADEITLKTIVRANPGLVLLKDGVILAKWHYRDFPSPQGMDEHYFADILEQKQQKKETILAFLYGALFLLLVVVIKIFMEKICND